MSKRQKSETGSELQSNRIPYIFTNIFLIVLLVIVCVWFAYSYTDLRVAIQNERAIFVEETVAQIITSHQNMQQEYRRTVDRFSEIVDHSNAVSLADLSSHFLETDLNSILLVSCQGHITDLSGNILFLTDMTKKQTLLTSDGGAELFASLNNKKDFWLFSSPIEPLAIDDEVYKSIILAIPEDEYRSTLSTSLYDKRGAAYVINLDGSIEVRPSTSTVPFSGYNLFASMVRLGASEQSVNELKTDMIQNNEGSHIICVADTDWLINFGAFGDGNLVIILVPLSVTAADTYRGLNGTIFSAVCTITLISVIVALFYIMLSRREKERARKMMAVEAKSDFFSKMSHDIRTPLNAIVGLQTLAMDKCDDPVVAGYLEQSSTSTQYLLSIINDVLEMSRIESGKVELDVKPFDINAVISDTSIITGAMASGKGVEFVTKVCTTFDLEYIGDVVRTKQILINILNNAVKFTNAGGQICFSVSKHSLDDTHDEIVFIISDTGIGISSDFLSRIFTPFDQEHPSMTSAAQGSGLGLAIVSSLVHMMDGEVTVESKLDEGSTFTVRLPFERGVAVATAVEEQREQKRFPGKRILMAEDNRINQTIAIQLLKNKFAIDVEAANDGETAVRMFTGAASGYYDLILMDIKMPKMDGLEAARCIRASDKPEAKTIPIIALSANTFKEDVDLSLAAGMNDHLTKPMDVDALSRTFQKYIK